MPPRIEKYVNVIVKLFLSFKNTLSQSYLFLLPLWITNSESSSSQVNPEANKILLTVKMATS